MPKDQITGSGAERPVPARPLAMLALGALLLAGCVGGGAGDENTASRMNLRQAGIAGQPGENGSALIADLQARRSVLSANGPFAQVADSVLQADAGAAAAELRIARLRSNARSKNWLPKLGPAVTLTSLNGLAAGLVLEQALFDHGRRKAERAYAAADVEVAAVTLSSDINQRIFEGLSHYVNSERARAQRAVSARASERLAEFADVMRQRVEGGLSDRSEEQVIAQKLAEMQATRSADEQAETTAMAELAAMAASPLSEVRGIERLAVLGNGTEPLSLVKSRAEATRSIAEAKIARAGLLPSLTASADMTGDGINPGVRLGGSGLWGIGTKDEFAALDATGDMVSRRTAEAGEAAERRIVALESQIAQLENQRSKGAQVLARTKTNLDLFVDQYKLGRRSLLELVSQYDSYARLERDQSRLAFDIALLELEIARDRGLLVDGARM